jgi:hypothetical protein
MQSMPPLRGVRAEALTWPQIEAALKSSPTILIPNGAGCKEHGFHLPMNTDLLCANYLVSRRSAESRNSNSSNKLESPLFRSRDGCGSGSLFSLLVLINIRTVG